MKIHKAILTTHDMNTLLHCWLFCWFTEIKSTNRRVAVTQTWSSYSKYECL